MFAFDELDEQAGWGGGGGRDVLARRSNPSLRAPEHTRSLGYHLLPESYEPQKTQANISLDYP